MPLISTDTKLFESDKSKINRFFLEYFVLLTLEGLLCIF
jgi:hypothetical protein